MTGSHEVDGSIPFSSTKDNQGVICARNGGNSPFFNLKIDANPKNSERLFCHRHTGWGAATCRHPNRQALRALKFRHPNMYGQNSLQLSECVCG